MVPGAFFYLLEVFVATKLFVGNLPFNITPEELEGVFGGSGTVESVNIITDKFTGRSRGFGFVEMSSAEEAQAAIESLHGHEMQGRALTVNEAKPQQPRTGGGGGRGDRGDRGDRRW